MGSNPRIQLECYRIFYDNINPYNDEVFIKFYCDIARML
jgi:hypothetical protein